jgi:hypothetical protein
VVEWKHKPSRPDNHLLDCLVGCAVGASMSGCTMLQASKPAAGAKKKKRKKVSYME